MASNRVSIPKYRLHRGSGQAFLQVKGKRHYLGVFGSPASKERYSRFIAELAANPLPIPQPPPVAQAEITIIELCAAFWDFAEGYYTKNGNPSGWLVHIRLVLRMVQELYGSTSAADFGPLAFKAIRQKLIDAGHSRKYINKLMAIVPRIFKWAAAEELVPGAVYGNLKTVEGLKKGRTTAHDHPPVEPVSDAVVDATLEFLPQVVADMVRFQRLTGARPGEVCQFRPMDLVCSGEVWEFRPATHKTEHHDKARTIYIGPQAQAVLLPYLLRPADSFCFSPAESEANRRKEMRANRKTKVQPSQRNRKKAYPLRQPKAHYTKDSYGRAVRRAVIKANEKILEDAVAMGIDKPATIPAWHPNQLRHSAATEIRKQFGLEAAQIILGHAKADVTQIYAERDATKAIEVIRKIG